MNTQYIPVGSSLAASAFRRLDREIAVLHKQIALSSLWAWNYASTAYLPGRSSVCVQTDPVEHKRWRWELAVAALVACLALCACGPEDSSPKTPEISDPFRPPPELRPQLRGLHVYQVKGDQGPGKDVVIIVQKGAE